MKDQGELQLGPGFPWWIVEPSGDLSHSLWRLWTFREERRSLRRKTSAWFEVEL
jgi:hypothetical protein